MDSFMAFQEKGKMTDLMQQPISRHNDDAVPFWQRDLSDQLPGVILPL